MHLPLLVVMEWTVEWAFEGRRRHDLSRKQQKRKAVDCVSCV